MIARRPCNECSKEILLCSKIVRGYNKHSYHPLIVEKLLGNGLNRKTVPLDSAHSLCLGSSAYDKSLFCQMGDLADKADCDSIPIWNMVVGNEPSKPKAFRRPRRVVSPAYTTLDNQTT